MNTVRLILLASLGAAQTMSADARGPEIVDVKLLTVLPADFRHPESLAADPETGQLYVGSFDAREPSSARNNQILRLSGTGEVLARVTLGETPLTGLAYSHGHIYFLNFATSRLQRLPAAFVNGTAAEDIVSFSRLDPANPPPRDVPNPDGSTDRVHFGAARSPALNGLAFDSDGNAYVSDSFQGAIYRVDDAIGCGPCKVTVLARDGLLATGAAMPFGANGLAVDEVNGVLYVNNAGDGRVLRLPLAGGAIEIVAEGLYGADGLLLHEGRLWVAANQIDSIVAIDTHGKVQVRAGSFKGIGVDGSPQGLLFPSDVISDGKRLVVANLALPLTSTEGDEWEEEVSRWNLMEFEPPLPSVRDGSMHGGAAPPGGEARAGPSVGLP